MTGVLACATAQAMPYVWVEGEKPTQANFQYEPQGGGPAGLLSEGKWLARPAKAEAKVPAEGLLLRYDMKVPEDGQYEVWARVGFERVRPPMEWRIGEGNWTQVGPDAHTTSLMRLGLWMEVAWLQLGSADLKAGNAPLQIRYREPGRDGRLLIGLDCLILTKGHFVPEGRLKPDEQYDRDLDKAAAVQVHRPAASGPAGARIDLRLDGPWQVARYDDPDMDKDALEPVKALPSAGDYPLHWMGIKVPSNAWDTPELAFGHRLVYRTRVEVPAAMAGRSFVLHFSGTNWLASVFVNRTSIGTHRGVLVPWDLDITRGIKPGQTNEIAIAIKGPYYAMDTNARKSTREQMRNLPPTEDFLRHARWIAPIWPSSKGEGNGNEYGLVNPVQLTIAGPAYVSDVFVKPSVSRKRLDAEITLTNPAAAPRKVAIRCEAINLKTGQVEHTFPPAEATVEGNSTKTLAIGGDWANPRLWWPVDNPDLYTLRTSLLDGSAPVDVHEQTFGFREVSIDGTHIRLNGIIRNFWNFVAVSGKPATPEEWLKQFRKENNRYYRFAHDAETRKFFPYREARLDFYDRNGIPGRLSTCIDGMFINYDLNNPLVWENFGEHLQQVTRAYRNHPSIMMYSVENELIFINGQNVFLNILDKVEDHFHEMIQRCKATDPTRPYMVDGGGALKGDRLEINCFHYPEAPIDYYPENAFTFDKLDDHSSRWPWDRKRPAILGEMLFYAGKVEMQAWIGGDRAFRSRLDADYGASRNLQILMEGYRWQGIAGVCPWAANQNLPGAERVFSDLAAFTRHLGHRFYAGKESAILAKVFNDTLSADPVTFEWSISLDGKEVAGKKVELKIEPGTGLEQTLAFTPPAAAARQDGQLLLRASQNGKVGYEHRLPIVVLPPVTKIAAAPLTLYDKSGKLAAYLQARGVQVSPIDSLAQLKGSSGLLLVGPDTLAAAEAYASDILAFAARGGKAILLEQETPLEGAALPAPQRVTPHFGGFAFGQAFGTPVFANLKGGDFEDWAGDHPTYKRAYLKPAGGARSLIQCGPALNDSALIEAPAGDGVIVAVQMRVGAKLTVEPAADQLLKNLLEHYSAYAPPKGTTALFAAADAPIRQALADANVRAEGVTDLRQALDPARFQVAIIQATAANLAALAQAKDQCKAFAESGRWIMLWGLEPDGLAACNQLVGSNHQIRPFRIERVTLEKPEHPLAATLGNRDFNFYSAQPLMHGDNWLSQHVYSFVVGADDAAPFCQMPGGPEDLLAYKPTFDDKDPYNFVNGMLNRDSWRYIRQIWIPQQGAEPLVFGFRRPESIRQVNLWNNINYWTIKDLDIIFDGDEKNALHVELPGHDGMAAFKVDPPRTVNKSITLQIRSWREEPAATTRGLRLVGIDNVQFLRALPEGYAARVQPLDNVGGLVTYPVGRGGIMLNQLKFAGDESRPQNMAKKVGLLATILQNMGASLRSSTVIVPGVNVQYTPIDITKYANRWIRPNAGQPEWFGDRKLDLAHLPNGQNYFADVLYHISDFSFAPIPQAIMLGNPNGPAATKNLPRSVEKIVIGRKADALYFLHAASVQRPIDARERNRSDFKPPELFKYIVRYADNSTAEVPVLLGENVDHWLQKSATPLPGARVGWNAPFPEPPKDGSRPVIYSMSWTNPKPEVAIASIDVVAGKDATRATPALLAITVGTRGK